MNLWRSILTHKGAAKNLGVDHEVLLLEHGGGKKWRANTGDDWSGVEVAALNHYSRDGWHGYPGEGGLMLNLIKAAALPNMHDRDRGSYTEAIFSEIVQLGDRHPLNEMLNAILAADLAQIKRIFGQMAAPKQMGMVGGSTPGDAFYLDSSMLNYFPHLREWHFTELFKSIGSKRLHDLARAFGADPYEYRKGWPDLTLWRNDKLMFKEIKSPGDRIRASQRKTICDILLPLGYEVAIVDVVSA
jgi:hypothetical protein